MIVLLFTELLLIAYFSYTIIYIIINKHIDELSRFYIVINLGIKNSQNTKKIFVEFYFSKN